MSRRSSVAEPTLTLADCPVGSEVRLPRQNDDGTRFWSWVKVVGHKDGQLRLDVPEEGMITHRLAPIVQHREKPYSGPLVRQPEPLAGSAPVPPAKKRKAGPAAGAAAAPVKLEHQAEYTALRKRYLEPIVATNTELPMSGTLRRQTKPAFIDDKSKAVKALKARIKELERSNDHVAIYNLLKQIKDWQMSCGGAAPPAMRLHVSAVSGDIAETVDLSEAEPAHVTVDLERWITDVLLIAVVKSDPDAAAAWQERTAVVKQENLGEQAPQIHASVKREADDEPQLQDNARQRRQPREDDAAWAGAIDLDVQENAALTAAPPRRELRKRRSGSDPVNSAGNDAVVDVEARSTLVKTEAVEYAVGIAQAGGRSEITSESQAPIMANEGSFDGKEKAAAEAAAKEKAAAEAAAKEKAAAEGADAPVDVEADVEPVGSQDGAARQEQSPPGAVPETSTPTLMTGRLDFADLVGTWQIMGTGDELTIDRSDFASTTSAEIADHFEMQKDESGASFEGELFAYDAAQYYKSYVEMCQRQGEEPLPMTSPESQDVPLIYVNDEDIWEPGLPPAMLAFTRPRGGAGKPGDIALKLLSECPSEVWPDWHDYDMILRRREHAAPAAAPAAPAAAPAAPAAAPAAPAAAPAAPAAAPAAPSLGNTAASKSSEELSRKQEDDKVAQLCYEQYKSARKKWLAAGVWPKIPMDDALELMGMRVPRPCSEPWRQRMHAALNRRSTYFAIAASPVYGAQLGFSSGDYGPNLTMFCWGGGKVSVVGLMDTLNEDVQGRFQAMFSDSIKEDFILSLVHHEAELRQADTPILREPGHKMPSGGFINLSNGRQAFYGCHGGMLNCIADIEKEQDILSSQANVHSSEAREQACEQSFAVRDPVGGSRMGKTTREGDLELTLYMSSIDLEIYPVSYVMRPNASDQCEPFEPDREPEPEADAANTWKGYGDAWFSTGVLG